MERTNASSGGLRRITPEDVNVLIEDPGFQRDDFLSTYWESATSLEKIITLLMVKHPELHTMSETRQYLADEYGLRPKAVSMNDAFQRLVDLRSILKRTAQGYFFTVGAFPRVIQGTLTLQDMMDVLIEEFGERQE
jgi:hypothetical protein